MSEPLKLQHKTAFYIFKTQNPAESTKTHNTKIDFLRFLHAKRNRTTKQPPKKNKMQKI